MGAWPCSSFGGWVIVFRAALCALARRCCVAWRPGQGLWLSLCRSRTMQQALQLWGVSQALPAPFYAYPRHFPKRMGLAPKAMLFGALYWAW
jgi:hypothetical protein